MGIRIILKQSQKIIMVTILIQYKILKHIKDFRRKLNIVVFFYVIFYCIKYTIISIYEK